MINRLLKKMIYVFLAIFMLTSTQAIIHHNTNQIIMDYYDLSKDFSAFEMPQYIQSKEQREQLIDVLYELSHTYQVNIVSRISNGWQNLAERDFMEEETIHYYITNIPHSDLLNRFQLSQESLPQPVAYYTEQSGMYCTFSVFPLQQLDDHFYSLFIETTDPVVFEQFLLDLSNKYNGIMNTQFSASDFDDRESVEELSLHLIVQLVDTLKFTLLFIVILTILWQLSQSTTIGILRLHGYSTFAIFKALFVSKYSCAFVVLLLSLCAYLLREQPPLYIIGLFGIILFMILLLYGLTWLMTQFSVTAQLNHKRTGRIALTILYVLKFMIVFICFALLTPLFGTIEATFLPQVHPDLNDYSVLYPMSVGKDSKYFGTPKEFHGMPDFQLVEFLNKHGALLFDTSQAMGNPDADDPSISKHVRVNLNYLKKFPIISATGQIIDIHPDNPNKIILVPERFSIKMDTIEKYYADPELKHQKIDYYMIKDDPQLHNLNDPRISLDDCIIVIQKINDDDSYMWYINGGSYDANIKVNTAAMDDAIHREFEILKKKLAKDDAFHYLIPVNEIRSLSYQEEIGYLKHYFWQVSFALYLLISMTICLVLFYIRLFIQKITVRLLHGDSLFRIFRPLYLTLVIQLIGYVICGLIFESSNFIITGVVLTVFEWLILHLIIRYNLQPQLLHYLKGESQ